MMPQLRIHVAVLGYLGDRIFAPAIQMKADAVYLLKLPNETEKKSLNALKKIRKELKRSKITLIEKDCDIFKVPDVVKTVKNIMEKESTHHLFFNISSGNTLSSNSLTIASMLYKNVVHNTQLYYIEYDYNKMRIKYPLIIIDLPAFSIHSPDSNQQKIIKFIAENPEGVTKKKIIIFLNSNFPNLSKNEKSKEIMSLNRKIIDKLQYDWKMISISGKGKSAIITLTEEGKQFIQFV